MPHRVPHQQVRFAYKDQVFPLSPPPLTYSPSTAPSSHGLITPPNMALPLPHHKKVRHPARIFPHRYLIPNGITWDSLHHPSTSTRHHRLLDNRALHEPASTPPLPYIKITCPHLLWSCKVHASNGHYVSLLDVLDSLFRSLHVKITPPEFHSPMLSETDRLRATRAYQERYKRHRGSAYEQEKRSGMKRVDFLMGHTRFAGLSVDDHQPDRWLLHMA